MRTAMLGWRNLKAEWRISSTAKEESIEQDVIVMRQQHPDWGKLRIADEMAKENNWVAVISPNTVRRILQAADLWPEEPKVGRKKASELSAAGR